MSKGEINNNVNSSSRRYIPLELITEIHSWLPVKSLIRFKCVSESWNQLIKDQQFIKLHRKRRSHDANPDKYTFLANIFDWKTEEEKLRVYSFRLAPTTASYQRYEVVVEYAYPWNVINHYCHPSCATGILIGQCNGLLFFVSHCGVQDKVTRSRGKLRFSLYNPVTRDFRMLPPLYHTQPHVAALGYDDAPHTSLGYDRVSEDYKVLAFFVWEREFMIYSLKRDAWEVIPDAPFERYPHHHYTAPNRPDKAGSSAMANNFLYWKQPPNEITCFDLFTHEFSGIPYPPTEDYYYSILVFLRGQLCVVTYKLDIWMLELNKHDGTFSSWTPIFRHQSGRLNNYHPTKVDMQFSCFEDEQRRIILTIFTHRSEVIKNNLRTHRSGVVKKNMICCDPESNEAKEIEVISLLDDDRVRIVNIFPWVESLVPLH